MALLRRNEAALAEARGPRGAAWPAELIASGSGRSVRPPELDVEKVRRFCAARIPAKFADEVRLEVTTRGKNVSIHECRPVWRGAPGSGPRCPSPSSATTAGQLDALLRRPLRQVDDVLRPRPHSPSSHHQRARGRPHLRLLGIGPRTRPLRFSLSPANVVRVWKVRRIRHTIDSAGGHFSTTRRDVIHRSGRGSADDRVEHEPPSNPSRFNRWVCMASSIKAQRCKAPTGPDIADHGVRRVGIERRSNPVGPGDDSEEVRTQNTFVWSVSEATRRRPP